MALEHRWSRRKQVKLDAFIFHRLAGLIRANILNLGLEGVFIDAGCQTLPPQSSVELTFALHGNDLRTIHQMEALVIHQAHNGYGLMFKDFRHSAFQAIKAMLYAGQL